MNNLPDNSCTTVFYADDINAPFKRWNKPAGAKLIHIICIGGGAGGGAGAARASGNNGGGGGGGGSSAITRMTLDGAFCPDYLSVYVGTGGAGGDISINSGVGEDGVPSYVAIPNIMEQQYGGTVLIQSGNAYAKGGGLGTIVAVGSGGTASTAFVSPTFGGLGTWVSIAGQVGSAGGAAGAVGGSTSWGTLFISSGAGGGGTNTSNANAAGGAIAPSTPPYFQQIAGGAAGGGAGGGGISLLGKPPISTGGSGGGAFGLGVGGNGGSAGFGSGGAGGGSGITGGTGGHGGDGIVIITVV